MDTSEVARDQAGKAPFGSLGEARPLEVKDLRFFIAVYEAKGFSHACETLGTVQSNVSSRIRNLERLLGVALFERRYRGVVPTENGNKIYEHAKLVMAALDHTQTVLQSPPATEEPSTDALRVDGSNRAQ